MFEAFNEIGLVYEAQGDIMAALLNFERAIEVCFFEGVYVEQASNASSWNKKKCLSCMYHVQQHDSYAQAHYNRGRMLRQLKRFDEALHAYSKVTCLAFFPFFLFFFEGVSIYS